LNAECTEAYRCDSNTSILNPEKPPEKVTSAPVADGSKGPYGTWLVRLTPRGAEEIMEVRVAVVGNVDAGKSTTLGVLTRGGLDDGRGKARVALFRHPHEIETGRTSSVGGEILGFSPKGEAVVPTGHVADVMSEHGHLAAAKREKMGWEEICKRAAKVVSFIDLAGHERYVYVFAGTMNPLGTLGGARRQAIYRLSRAKGERVLMFRYFKTTLYGLSGCAPDYVMLMVGGNAGLIGMSKEHLGVALALNVPIAVCVTKVSSACAYETLAVEI
jgi:GTPase